MKKFSLLILSVINAIVSGIYIAMLPVDIVPSHYNIMGEVDAYSSKWFYMFMPCILILLAVINLVRYTLAEKGKLESYEVNKEFKIVVGIFVFFLALFWYLTVASIKGNMNISPSLSPVLNILLGGFIIYLSNMFGKIKQNRFFGIRLNSTLNSKYVWKKTHRLGGYMGVIAGFIMVIIGIISLVNKNCAPYLLPVSLGCFIVLGVIIPTIYSYVLYAKEKSSK